MDWKQKLAKARELFEGASAILNNPDAGPEEKAKVQPMLDDAQKLKAEAVQLKDIEAAGMEIAAMQTETPKQQTSQTDFKFWGEFLEAVWLKEAQGKADARLKKFRDEEPSGNTRRATDLRGSSGAAGGYLIPIEQMNKLMAAMAESAIIRSRATVIPMRRRQLDIPALDQTQELSAGVPRWFGGLQFYWIGEGEEKPQSDPKFRDISLVAKKLAAYTRSSDELLDDSAISLEAFLQGPLGFAGGVAWIEDYAFLHGTGVAQPLGILNSPALLTVRRDVSGKVRYDDLVRMLAVAMPSARLTWVISQSVLVDLLNMKDDDGRLIWATATEGGAQRLLGLPYIVSEKMPIKGTTGDVLLADFSMYLIGDRQSTTVETTKFDRWRFDQTSWRVVHRVDGQPWLNAPLTYQDGTTQVSPFVALSSDVS